MSSHREAPGTSKDPVIDSTDLYAFVSPDRPAHGYRLGQLCAAPGPRRRANFFEFGDDVLYSIHIDNNGDGLAEWTYNFNFKTETVDPNTFLYNTSTIKPPPLGSTAYANLNRPQFYYVSLVDASGRSTILQAGLPCPPCNIGPRSTPDYRSLSAAAIRKLHTGEVVFAGQRAEGFFVDLGSIFDLGGLRPLNSHHLIPLANATGLNSLASKNVHTIAIQVPISKLTSSRVDAHQPDGPGGSARVLDHGEPPDSQEANSWRYGERQRPLCPVVPPGEPVGQRGGRACQPEGLFQQPAPCEGQPVCGGSGQPRTRKTNPRAVPRGLP